VVAPKEPVAESFPPRVLEVLIVRLPVSALLVLLSVRMVALVVPLPIVKAPAPETMPESVSAVVPVIFKVALLVMVV